MFSGREEYCRLSPTMHEDTSTKKKSLTTSTFFHRRPNLRRTEKKRYMKRLNRLIATFHMSSPKSIQIMLGVRHAMLGKSTTVFVFLCVCVHCLPVHILHTENSHFAVHQWLPSCGAHLLNRNSVTIIDVLFGETNNDNNKKDTKISLKCRTQSSYSYSPFFCSFLTFPGGRRREKVFNSNVCDEGKMAGCVVILFQNESLTSTTQFQIGLYHIFRRKIN